WENLISIPGGNNYWSRLNSGLPGLPSPRNQRVNTK
ncbi:hypothetical protein A2U01_0081467, partial [Trifolium medium]|nr:hypothetical protein [Trifolium medium]